MKFLPSRQILLLLAWLVFTPADCLEVTRAPYTCITPGYYMYPVYHWLHLKGTTILALRYLTKWWHQGNFQWASRLYQRVLNGSMAKLVLIVNTHPQSGGE